MNSVIRDCLPPDRKPRKPNVVLPKGSIDTHVHVFERARYNMNPDRGYNPPDSTLADFTVAAPLFHAKAADLPVGPYARVQDWFGRVSAQPCWRETAPQASAVAA